MNFTPDSIFNALLGALGGGSVAFWLLRRFVGRVDRLEAKITSLELTVQNLATKEHVASKEDMSTVSSRLGDMEKSLTELKIAVAVLAKAMEFSKPGV